MVLDVQIHLKKYSLGGKHIVRLSADKEANAFFFPLQDESLPVGSNK